MELRHVVRFVYREAGTGLSSKSEKSDITSLPDVDKMKQLVHRYAVFYKRLKVNSVNSGSSLCEPHL